MSGRASAKVVVVTGSTRGIGLGLGRELLLRGCSVVVSGRSPGAVQAAVVQLGGGERVLGVPADVTSPAELQGLWDASVGRFGRVDVWINNAGVSTPRRTLAEVPSAALAAVVETNLLGTLYGCQVALRGMVQAGHGQLWLVEGFGSGGEKASGMAAYGATKKAVRYLHAALQQEASGTGVQVCALSPGIVLTDLLFGDYAGQPEQLEKAKRIFNILGDRVETVTPWIADRVLATDRTGAQVRWLTRRKAFGRFAAAPVRKRDLFADLPA